MVRTSGTFQSLWHTFIQTSIGVDLSPIFIQYVGHHRFKDMLKEQFPVCAEKVGLPNELNYQELNYQELNAIRYAAGFVPRALKKKLKKRPTSD